VRMRLGCLPVPYAVLAVAALLVRACATACRARSGAGRAAAFLARGSRARRPPNWLNASLGAQRMRPQVQPPPGGAVLAALSPSILLWLNPQLPLSYFTPNFPS